MTTTKNLSLALAAAALSVSALPALAADAVADFYRGKQIKLVVGTEPGSGYDTFGRVIIRHMGKHIPGNPTFLPQMMPGASGRVAANWLYALAPRDGLTIATFTQTAPVDQARKQEGVTYDVTKFNWIGNPIVDNTLTISWADAGYKTVEDVKAKGGLICGGTAASSPSNTFPQVLNNMAGTRIRIISGYPSSGAAALALERGEVNCVGSTWPVVKHSQAHLLKDKKLNILVQWGVEKNPEIAAYQGRDVPLSAEFAKTDMDRKVLDIINSGIAIGRPIVAPQDVPKERVEALRRAFDATMKDPEFLADAAKEKLDVIPISGEKLQQIATAVAQAPADVLQRVDEVMTPRDIEKLKQ
jgi:tripartite-type tricarboxylate transporter receptor subunit TctC